MIKFYKGDADERQTAFFTFQELTDLTDVICLRDALLHTIEVCVSLKEAKESCDSYHLFLLIRMVEELNRDIQIEIYNNKKGV